MRTTAIVVFLLILCSTANAYQFWNDVRHSALLPDSAVTIRMENISGAGIENYALYNDGGVRETVMLPILDGPSTLAANVPGPAAGTGYYGFRLLQGTEIDIMPVRIADDANPLPEDLTRISTDPAGDELFGYANLDLVDCHFSFSGDSLYGSLTNAGGGFPVIQGLTFFGYLVGIADPALADPDTVFGMMYTFEAEWIIRPGFYKITGPGTGDLVLLGDVTIEEFPASNTLRLSCELAPLMSDPYFLSWYNPADPVIGVAGFTQRITILGGPAEADESPGGRCFMRQLSIGPVTNTLPEISGFMLLGEGATATAQIDYSDADANCPVIAEIEFDGGGSYSMYPSTLDYASTVTYSTEAGIDPLANGTWTTALVRFSDNLSDSVTYEAPTVGIDDGRGPDLLPAFSAAAMPNPSKGAVSIAFTMGSAGTMRIDVYDSRGALVSTPMEREVAAGPGLAVWSGRDGKGRRLSPGVYYIRVAANGQQRSLKAVLVD